MSPTDIVDGAGRMGADALLICPTDKMTPDLIAGPAEIDPRHRHLLGRLRAHQSGCGQGARHRRHQHAGRADRRHRRHRHAADAGRGAAGLRGRADRARQQLEFLGHHLHAGRPYDRQAAGHPRHGPHRPGGGQARPRLRHEDPLRQPPPAAAGPGAGRDLPRRRRRHAAALRLPVDQLPGVAGDLPFPECGSGSPSCPTAPSS